MAHVQMALEPWCSELQPNHSMYLVQRLHAVAVMLRVVIQAAGCSPEGCVTKLPLDAVTQMSSRLRCAAVAATPVRWLVRDALFLASHSL